MRILGKVHFEMLRIPKKYLFCPAMRYMDDPDHEDDYMDENDLNF